MNNLVSEFFIDIITRIIPGLIILALYPDRLFNIVFNEFQKTQILLIPGLIGAAWIIGFAFEQAVYLSGAFPVLLIRKVLLSKGIAQKFHANLRYRRFRKKSLCVQRRLIGSSESSPQNEAERGQLLKQAGELILFRV